MKVSTTKKEQMEEILAGLPPRPLHRVLFNLAECYNSSSEQSFAKIQETGNADFAAPAIMCKSFAIELLLKFFIVADYPLEFSKEDIDAAQGNLRGHSYSSLFDRISAHGQASIAKRHSERTGNSVTTAEFRAILISLGDDPFVGWRYMYENSTFEHLDVELLSTTVDSIGLAAQDATRRLGGLALS